MGTNSLSSNSNFSSFTVSLLLSSESSVDIFLSHLLYCLSCFVLYILDSFSGIDDSSPWKLDLIGLTSGGRFQYERIVSDRRPRETSTTSSRLAYFSSNLNRSSFRTGRARPIDRPTRFAPTLVSQYKQALFWLDRPGVSLIELSERKDRR